MPRKTGDLPPNQWRLTGMQYQVVTAVLSGCTTKEEIAARLGNKPRTVQTHLTAIYDKMQLRNRNMVEMILKFLGWIQ